MAMVDETMEEQVVVISSRMSVS